MQHDYSILCKSILVIAILLGILSFGEGKGVYATKVSVNQEKPRLQSLTGSTKIPKPREDKKKNCDADCKIKEMTSLGFRHELASSLVKNCKASAKDPVHCIKYGFAIMSNESSKGFKCKKLNKYNCSGLNINTIFKNYDDGVKDWVKRYNKDRGKASWHKATTMSHFYSPAGSYPTSRYCTSEDSSRTTVGCPNGLKHSTYYFNKLTF